MVQCFHQSNVHMKMKLRLFRAQKCIPLVGAMSALTCASPQTTPSNVRQYRAENGNFGKSWPRFRNGAVFAQSNAYIESKLGLWRAHKCISLVGAKSALTCAGQQTTPSHVRQYRAENGNLRKFGPTFRHGAVFTPKQCLYQTEVRAMESPKMYSSSRCKNRTYMCGSANYHVSCKAV